MKVDLPSSSEGLAVGIAGDFAGTPASLIMSRSKSRRGALLAYRTLPSSLQDIVQIVHS